MGERLGMILPAPERLDPGCREQVPARSLGTGDLPVRDVADERVAEGVLVLARDGARGEPPDELLLLQRPKREPDLRGLEVADGRNRVRPEAAADHRRILEHELLVPLQRVDPRCDDSLHRLGQWQLAFAQLPAPVVAVEKAAIDEHADELLGVQRVPLCAREQRLPELGRNERLPKQIADERARLRIAQRGKRDRDCVRTSSPRRPPLTQLGPRGADQDERRTRRPVGQMVEEVEQALVRPVKVFDHQHERAPGRERLERAAPGSKRIFPTLAYRSVEREQQPQVALDPLGLARVGHEIAHGAVQLRLRHRRVVRLEDPGLRFDHLAEGPERHPIAVREGTDRGAR